MVLQETLEYLYLSCPPALQNSRRCYQYPQELGDAVTAGKSERRKEILVYYLGQFLPSSKDFGKAGYTKDL